MKKDIEMITNLSIIEIRDQVQSKKLKAEEVAEAFFVRAQTVDKKLNSVITYNEKWRTQAQELDKKIQSGHSLGKLAGVPFGIKDMLCTKGLKTTAGSKMLANFVPPYDATVVSRLKDEGAIVLAKLNQDEFAMGSTNETSFFGKVKNPWNLDRVPGGSSGGSAAAQSARLVAGAIGTDTGGSIRQPASFCGIVGIKPTYGRVSRFGVVAYASSLDQAGPMTKTVEDAALCLEVICGADNRDSTTSTRKVPEFLRNLNPNLKGKRIGIVREFLTRGGLHPDVEKAFQNAQKLLETEGAKVVEISIPLCEYAVPIYYLIATSEASSNLSRYDGVKYGFRSEHKNLSAIDLNEFYSANRGEGFGTEVKKRILLGTYCLSSGYYDAYYHKASQIRRKLTEEYKRAFQQCDVILGPVSATPAFEIGKKSTDPLSIFLNDVFTTSTNLAGLPGMSVPFAMSADKMPIGMQITGSHFDEQSILDVAYNLQQNSNVKGLYPDV